MKELLEDPKTTIGSDQTTNVASDWLTDLPSVNFSISLSQMITELEPMNFP